MPGTKGYYAVAKVERVVPNPSTPGMYLALIEPGSYLDFATLVPFANESGPIERGVLNDAGRISGRAQAAVCGLSPDDFSRIVEAGRADDEPLLPRTGIANAGRVLRERFVFDEARERIASLVSRVVRDRVFRRTILRAYDERCAVTGLKLINGGGRASKRRPTKRITSGDELKRLNGLAGTGGRGIPPRYPSLLTNRCSWFDSTFH